MQDNPLTLIQFTGLQWTPVHSGRIFQWSKSIWTPIGLFSPVDSSPVGLHMDFDCWKILPEWTIPKIPFFNKKTYFWQTQEHNGALIFATDTWTSPNHNAYVAVTVHFENAGVPILMLLDIIEVMCLHTGFNLAMAFSKILEEFRISDKVSSFYNKYYH